MKLVLKYNEVIKLYVGEMKYSKIMQFMSLEMGLIKESIQITYTDQDGDQIYLGDDNDFEVLTDLTDNKSYIKINVKGQVFNEKLKENIPKNFQSLKITTTQEQQVQKNQGQQKIEIKQDSEMSPDQSDEVNKKQQKKKTSSKKQLKNEKSQQKQKKIKKQVKKQKEEQSEGVQSDQMKKFTKLMTKTIISIVDERIEKLVCMKRKKDSLKKVLQKKEQIIHKGFSCKSCLIIPIIGVRYECPKCINFSICQDCQFLNEHQHHLLKIKTIKQSDNIKDKVNKNLKKIYNLLGNQKKKKQNQQQAKSILSKKDLQNCKQLKQIFGGKPNNYKSFVKQYPNLQFNQLLEAYCKENNIKIEQGKQKYAEMLSKRMVKLSKIQPNQLINNVKKNMKNNQSRQAEISNKEYDEKLFKLIESQIEEDLSNQQKVDTIEVKRPHQIFKFQWIQNKSQVEQQKPEIKSSDTLKKIEENKQEKAFIHTEVNKEAKSLSKAQNEIQKKSKNLKKQHVQIYDLMIQIFGEQRSEDYAGFIDKHFNEGTDNIIMLWSNNLFDIK